MTQIDDKKFDVLAEGIEAARVISFCLFPFLDEAKFRLPRQVIEILPSVERAVRRAYVIVKEAALTGVAEGRGEALGPNTQGGGIDSVLLRTELENISALTLPDLKYEMQVACEELPAWEYACHRENIAPPQIAEMLAWACEAGRRIGIAEATQILEHEFSDALETSLSRLTAELDRNLGLSMDLPGEGEYFK